MTAGAPWAALRTVLEREQAAVLVTLAETRGSVPREAGAFMVVRAGGAFTGTIGGGALEWLALAEAQKVLGGGPRDVTLDKALGPDLGQCCGGRAIVRLRRFTRDDLATVRAEAEREAASGDGATDVLLFGAGHVGRALVLALAPLPFRVQWIDPRPSAFPSHVPGNVTCIAPPDPTTALEGVPGPALVAVMTHSHALDLAVVAAALPDPRRFPYVGVIGSRTKRARFARQLADAGHPPDVVGRLVCPIGMREIAGKEPAVIAAGIAVQCLVERQRLTCSQTPDVRMVR